MDIVRPSGAYKFLGAFAVVSFLVTAFTPLPNLVSGWLATSARLESADSVVALGGGGVWPDGMLSNISMRRAMHAILLHRKGLAPLLVFSGAERGKHPTELEARVELARSLGVPAEAILTARADTTRDEASRLGMLLRPRGVRRILLVTDSQHLIRAQRLFEQAGFEVLAAPIDDVSNDDDAPEGRLELLRRALEEILARAYYRLAGYL